MVPGMGRWTTVVNKPELIEEIRKAPDDKVSFDLATKEVCLFTSTTTPFFDC